MRSIPKDFTTSLDALLESSFGGVVLRHRSGINDCWMVNWSGWLDRLYGKDLLSSPNSDCRWGG